MVPRSATLSGMMLPLVPPFDLTKRYVRLTQVRADGFVEFEFAIGDPGLAV
jgi:phenol hydroxylase P0 protein